MLLKISFDISHKSLKHGKWINCSVSYGNALCGHCAVQGILFCWPPHTDTKDLPEDPRPACFNVQLNVRYRLSKMVSVSSDKSQQVLFCDCQEKANDTELQRLPCHNGFHSNPLHSLDGRLYGCTLEVLTQSAVSALFMIDDKEKCRKHSIDTTRKASARRSVLGLDITSL